MEKITMIIIQMMGGLGNQMFQYALYRQLISMGKKVKIDDEAGFEKDLLREPELSVFGITYEKASRKEIMKMRDSSPAFAAKVRRKLFGRHNKSYFEESKLFQQKIFDWDDVYLEGYWQSEKYFSDVGESIRREFGAGRFGRRQKPGQGLKVELSPQAESYLWKIEQTKSVSLHVRRGDYLLPENQALFGNICTDSYYERAMKTVAGKHPGCIFYLFTNDLEWAEGWMEKYSDKGYKMILVDLPEEKDYEAFVLMSRCRHNILANSSFGWWASYFNDNPQKMVIAPEKWLNGWDCRDIYRKDMIKV